MSSKVLIEQLKGPILVVGAGGFVGANLFHQILKVRSDILGTVRSSNTWRLKGVADDKLAEIDINDRTQVRDLFNKFKPQTIFYLASYGAYSFQKNFETVFNTNLMSLLSFVETIKETHAGTLPTLIHAGSSSEYGKNSIQPNEDAPKQPDSIYSVSKNAAALFLEYLGQSENFPCINLRLYSVYGPYEDSSRLLPQLIFEGQKKQYPPLVNPEVSRDFVFVDDVVRAFILSALNLRPEHFGQSVNIGSGVQTSIRQIASVSQDFFKIKGGPTFETMPQRDWDKLEWSSNPQRAKSVINWTAETPLAEGFAQMVRWWQHKLADSDQSLFTVKGRDSQTVATTPAVSTNAGTAGRRKITAIVACYLDGQAIPFMYERLVKVFTQLGIDYEIIFVNDCSPDNSAQVIQEITLRDSKVIGISHSRNFGSQNAFLSGLEMSTGDGVVFLDGDLQDPPELIADFYEKWTEGYEVIYGHRIQREMSWIWERCYKMFYLLFDKMSSFSIPRNAGDFSLIDRRVANALLKFEERDVFLRGLRAYAGFKQVGVDYMRPERMFGASTNNLSKNIDWAKKGIFSFSSLPLKILTNISIIMIFIFALVFVVTFTKRILYPDEVLTGITTIVLLVIGFGSFNLLSSAILGEYIAKIFEESKQRPRFLRESIIRDGAIHPVSDSLNETLSTNNKSNQ